MKSPTWTTSRRLSKRWEIPWIWVIVRNPVKIPTTKFFQGSDLESQLLGLEAARLEIPALQRILSEIGLDMSRWPSEKHFRAWLNVAPNNRISGGKILFSKPLWSSAERSMTRRANC